MSEVQIRIGGRPFTVACQPGEESYLEAAAEMLDAEAKTLVDQLGKMPESQMLLMAGLMLADRTAGAEDQLRAAETRISRLEAELAQLKAKPALPPEKVEVPVIPPQVGESLAEIAARAEALADAVEEKAAG